MLNRLGMLEYIGTVCTFDMSVGRGKDGSGSPMGISPMSLIVLKQTTKYQILWFIQIDKQHKELK